MDGDRDAETRDGEVIRPQPQGHRTDEGGGGPRGRRGSAKPIAIGTVAAEMRGPGSKRMAMIGPDGDETATPTLKRPVCPHCS